MTNASSHVCHLREEFNKKQTLFHSQPTIVQRFIEVQAGQIAKALTEHLPQVRFSLPDRVASEVPNIPQPATMTVPDDIREQVVGSFRDRLLNKDVKEDLRRRLNQLEQSLEQAVSTSAGLLRYATAMQMVHNMLPAGRSVTYRPEEDEEIPSIPVADLGPESAITQATDAIVEENNSEAGRGALQVPFVLAARHFYLPQWVAFDEQGNLLVSSVKEAEAHVASMQRYLDILHAASSLAPYIMADEDYQIKRYGMLGQLVNQGRALAHYKAQEIIKTIKKRAKEGTLNRGLSLSLPYFDDQELIIRNTTFEAIPAGRIMFVPAFVVRAAREEAAKRTQDTRFSASTRKHLIFALRMLEKAFEKQSLQGNL
jgi:hypothetical protein